MTVKTTLFRTTF